MSGEERERTRSFGSYSPGKSRLLGYWNTSSHPNWRVPSWDKGWTTQNISGSAGYETCRDTNHNVHGGPLDDHNLDIYRKITRPFRVTGHRTTCYSSEFYSHNHTEFDRYIMYVTSDAVKGTRIPTLESWSYLKNRALSSINRDTPVVDAPLFLFELREFPRMLRDLGRYLNRDLRPSDAPGSFLGYKFGWAPLISDLISLLDLGRSVDNRLKWLRTLQSGKTEYSGRLGESKTEWLNRAQQFEGLKIEYRRADTREAWWTGSIEVSHKEELDDLIGKYSPRNSAEANRLLRSLTGTDRLRVETIWNAIPWTWLIDYFTSFGDFISFIGNNLPYDMKSMCIMQHGISKEESQVVENLYSLSFEDSYLLQEKKVRKVYHNPVPSVFTRRVLSNGQKSILGALLLARYLNV